MEYFVEEDLWEDRS